MWVTSPNRSKTPLFVLITFMFTNPCSLHQNTSKSTSCISCGSPTLSSHHHSLVTTAEDFLAAPVALGEHCCLHSSNFNSPSRIFSPFLAVVPVSLHPQPLTACQESPWSLPLPLHAPLSMPLGLFGHCTASLPFSCFRITKNGPILAQISHLYPETASRNAPFCFSGPPACFHTLYC